MERRKSSRRADRPLSLDACPFKGEEEAEAQRRAKPQSLYPGLEDEEKDDICIEETLGKQLGP